MAKDPAFLFYPSDFLTGTAFFTYEELGIYIKLLCIQHQQEGSINSKSFDSIVSEESIIRTKFKKDSDGYYNQRLLDEMIKRQKKSDNLSTNALKRWSKEKQKKSKSNAIASQMNMPTENEDVNENKDKNKGIDFERFWDAYDKKVGEKNKLKKKWESLTLETQKKILEHLPKYKESQPDKKYRKNPETYLNNKSWEDEIIGEQLPKYMTLAEAREKGVSQQILTEKYQYNQASGKFYLKTF